MYMNKDSEALVPENNGRHKWWYDRRVVVICISLILLINFTVILSLLLKFVTCSLKKPETITITNIATSTMTTVPQTTTTIRAQQSSKSWNNAFSISYMLLSKQIYVAALNSTAFCV
jgi:hypothetical protein